MIFLKLRHGIFNLALFILLSFSAACISIGGNGVDETSNLSATTVSKPVIASFIATPETASPVQIVTLSWNVLNAEKITIHPGAYEVEPVGDLQVTSATDSAYTLIAINEAGSVASLVNIRVTNPPETIQNYVGYDAVTGRNQDIGFDWEQLCLSSRYQVQIAKDPGFTLILFDSGVYAPDSTTSPALLYLAGGRLEAGHSYYWRTRVRQATSGQPILSPWSLPQNFTISAGYPVTSLYQGVQLLGPVNGCRNYPVALAPFTWSPYKGTSKYRFVLATDPELSDIVITEEIGSSSYVYNGVLEYNTNYFWQVMAIEPAPSDPSSIFTFTTESIRAVAIPDSTTQPTVPLYRWIVSGLGVILILIGIIIIALIKRN